MSFKFHFPANKIALFHHCSTCLSEKCMECVFHRTVNNFTFQKNSLLRYELGYANLDDTKTQPKTKRIKFEKGTKKEDFEGKVVKLNWICLQLAVFYFVSLSKIAHLKLWVNTGL